MAFAVLRWSHGRASDLAAVFAARAISQVLFTAVGGLLADRYGQAVSIAVSELTSFVATLIFVLPILLGRGSVLVLIASSALAGGCHAVFGPALLGLIPSLVGHSGLQAANGLIRIASNAAAVVGVVLVGVVIGSVGPGWFLVLDAGTFLVSGLLLLSIPNETIGSGVNIGLVGQLRGGWSELRGSRWNSAQERWIAS